ncbi:MAG: hypothetical protein ACKOQ6_10220, partial [Bacteroidota bacterium]
MKRIFVSTLLASMSMICSEVAAATYTWNGLGVSGSGTDLNAAANWLVGGSPTLVAPGSGDDLIINTTSYNTGGSTRKLFFSASSTFNSISSNIQFGGSTSQMRFELVLNANVTVNVTNDFTLSCEHPPVSSITSSSSSAVYVIVS